MMRRVVLALLILACSAITTAAEDAAAFRTALVKALRTRDTRAVDLLFAFPVRLTQAGGEPINVTSQSGFPILGVFWPDTVCAIENGAVQDDGQVVRIGKDLVVAQRAEGGALRVTAFKVSGGYYEPRKQPVASLDLRFHGAKRQAAGNLEFDEVDVYDVMLTKNITLQGTLERFPGNKAVIRVKDAKGKPVNAAADGRRSWTGTIPESGNYRVEVVRKAPYCEPLLTYLLTLTAR